MRIETTVGAVASMTSIHNSRAWTDRALLNALQNIGFGVKVIVDIEKKRCKLTIGTDSVYIPLISIAKLHSLFIVTMGGIRK